MADDPTHPERWWLGSNEGMTDEVLPPWTPLVAWEDEEAIGVSCWGREYRFRSLFPESITASGRQLVSGPIRLLVTTAGSRPAFGGAFVSITESTPARARISASATCGELRATGQASVEYDGMVRLDWSLAADRPLRLDGLRLEIPLKQEVARYLFHCPGRWGSAYNAGELPAEGYVSEFRPFIWLGDEECGLAWFCECAQNWHNADPNRAVEIVRSGEGVTLCLHLVDTPVLLGGEDGQLSYTCGLQATPVKPNPEDVWDYRITHAGNYGIDTASLARCATLIYPAQGNFQAEQGTLELWARPLFDPASLDEPRDLFLLNESPWSTVITGLTAGAQGIVWQWLPGRAMRFFIHRGHERPVDLTFETDWPRGEWRHLAFTWGEAVRVYLGGRLMAEADHEGTLTASLQNAQLEFGGNASEFALDEIRVSSRPRSPREIASAASGEAVRLADDSTLLLDHLDEDFEPDGVRATSPEQAAGGGGVPWGSAQFLPGHYGQGLQLYDQANEGKTMLDRMAELGVRTICFHEHWTPYQDYTEPWRPDELRSLVRACHERGIRLLLYFGFLMSDQHPDWADFSDQVLVEPRRGGPHSQYMQPPQNTYLVCYAGSVWQDQLVAGIARLIDEYDIDGVYLDGTANPYLCRNQRHGCGWRTPEGELAPTYTLFGARRLMRRLYAVIKRRKPEGLISVHQSTVMTIPSLAWATSYWDGEQFASIGRATGALTALPLDAFRCEFMGHQWGVPAEFLSYEQPFTYRQATGVCLLHDMLTRALALGPNLELESRLWRLADEFGRKQAEWIPYWRSADYAMAEPAETYVSLYRHPRNGLLAVVANLSGEAALVRVRFRLDRLGLGEVTVRDALDEGPVELSGDTVALSLPHLGWRLLWLRAPTP